MRTLRMKWFAAALAALILAGYASRAGAEDAKPKWEDLWGFPDCVYTCGNNSGHPNCSCTT